MANDPANNMTLLRLDIDREVATITLDSQHNRNALSRQLLDELHRALDQAEEVEARAIVLTHAGPAFCSGADLRERSSGPPDSGPMVAALERLMDTDRPSGRDRPHGLLRPRGRRRIGRFRAH